MLSPVRPTSTTCPIPASSLDVFCDPIPALSLDVFCDRFLGLCIEDVASNSNIDLGLSSLSDPMSSQNETNAGCAVTAVDAGCAVTAVEVDWPLFPVFAKSCLFIARHYTCGISSESEFSESDSVGVRCIVLVLWNVLSVTSSLTVSMLFLS